MGEIADMMLDGYLCEGCGVYMGGSFGGPRRCSGCKQEERSGPVNFAAPRNPAKVACPECGRHVKAAGLADHQRDKHGSSVGKEVKP
jgi:hypothetical protein